MRIVSPGGGVVASRVICARAAMERIGGWMFREAPAADEGLLLPGCACVHTWFVRCPIDIVFLDRGDRVLSVRANVRPWRVVACVGADSVLELAGGRAAAAGLSAGQPLLFEEMDAERGRGGPNFG